MVKPEMIGTIGRRTRLAGHGRKSASSQLSRVVHVLAFNLVEADNTKSASRATKNTLFTDLVFAVALPRIMYA